MKYIFITENKQYDLHHSINLQDCVYLQTEKCPIEWSKKFLTKKAYSDVYSGKAKFEDELKSDSLERLYNLILVLQYIIDNNVDDAIIIEDASKFYKMYDSVKGFHIDNIDILFLRNTGLPDSHFKGDGVYKQNQFVFKKSPAFYINFRFAKLLIKSQKKFYKPFEFTLNDYVNETKIFTLFITDKLEYKNRYSKLDSVYLNRYYILVTIIILVCLVFYISK